MCITCCTLHICWHFTFHQHLRSYQDGFRLVTVWRFDSAAPQEDETTITMTVYPTQPDYPNTGLTSPCPILVMPNARLGSDKYQF